MPLFGSWKACTGAGVVSTVFAVIGVVVDEADDVSDVVAHVISVVPVVFSWPVFVLVVISHHLCLPLLSSLVGVLCDVPVISCGFVVSEHGVWRWRGTYLGPLQGGKWERGHKQWGEDRRWWWEGRK